MRRRQFITLLGGVAAAAWPLAARAQQPAMPVIGFLYAGTPEQATNFTVGFRKGLGETGFVEGQNATIEYRWGNNSSDRLPALAADLVQRRVAVIMASSSAEPIFAAKAATSTIPIVFYTGADPVQVGLVASLNRPGGNLTGLGSMNQDLSAKRLGLLHDLLRGARRFAVLIRTGIAEADSLVANAKAAAASIGAETQPLYAGNSHDIDTAFAALVQKRADALLVSANPLFSSRRFQLVTLAARHAVPTIYWFRDFVEVGGLMSYGTNIADQYRQAGVYVGRILKGEKPADLPILMASKFELVINLQTAQALGLEVPPSLLATADEVIE